METTQGTHARTKPEQQIIIPSSYKHETQNMAAVPQHYPIVDLILWPNDQS